MTWGQVQNHEEDMGQINHTLCTIMLSVNSANILQTSPLPLPLASPLTWMLPRCSQFALKPKHQWSTGRTTSQSLWRLWQPLKSLVSCYSPPDPYMLLSKGMIPPAEKNSSTLTKDWQELCERTRKSVAATMNN